MVAAVVVTVTSVVATVTIEVVTTAVILASAIDDTQLQWWDALLPNKLAQLIITINKIYLFKNLLLPVVVAGNFYNCLLLK